MHNTTNENEYSKTALERSMYAKICIPEVRMNTRSIQTKINAGKDAVFPMCSRRYHVVFETGLVLLPNDNTTFECQQKIM